MTHQSDAASDRYEDFTEGLISRLRNAAHDQTNHSHVDDLLDMKATVLGQEWDFAAPRHDWRNYLHEDISLQAQWQIDLMDDDDVEILE